MGVTLEFDPDEHTYWHGERRLLSVTEVLDVVGLTPDFYRGLDPWYAQRGHLVHEAIARAAKGGQADPDPRVADRVDRALALLDAVQMRPVIVESRMGCARLGVAGTMDFLGRSSVGWCMLDWKASEAREHDRVQLGGYRALLRVAADRGLVPGLGPAGVDTVRLAVVPLASGAIARPRWIEDPDEAEADFLAAARVARMLTRKEGR